MAFASSIDLFRFQAQHTASVLALSFAGFHVEESGKEEDYKGNFRAVPSRVMLYLGKTIGLYFHTARIMSKVNETTLNFSFGPIEWHHAQMAPKVWSRLPTLLPPFHEWLKQRHPEFEDEEYMAREIDRPCVTFGSDGDRPEDEWTFEVTEPSYQFVHFATFRGFEIVDFSTVG